MVLSIVNSRAPCSLQTLQTLVCDGISCLPQSGLVSSGARSRPWSNTNGSHALQLNRGIRKAFSSTPARQLDPKSSNISYRVAASSSGKGRRFNPLQNHYNFDASKHDSIGVSHDKNIATRRQDRPDSGEDAFFVSRIGKDPAPNYVAFAVADGVGGWNESRVDPADFSHGICSYMAHSALTWDKPSDKLRPMQLLREGYDRLCNDPSVRAGGSTASVGVGLPGGHVELANLGDSGSVLFRLAAVHHYSTPQTHAFNTPYQLSKIPPRMRAQSNIFGGGCLEDFPEDAAISNLQMQHGDVLILATDGVFDNLNNQDLLKIVSSRMIVTGAWSVTSEYAVHTSNSLGALTAPGGIIATPTQDSSSDSSSESMTLQAVLAASIASEAKIASVNTRRDGPFAKEAQRYLPGDYYRGGKVDDICVLAVVAVDESLTA
ncbi:hypothetical protein N7495_004592 [Penicillium taxi]|uniref:uncharacterized protein n=1 Tax=Penicillium taxi TaxID=168475 RepID=UPI00254534EC|nr:uncharacterized protein N7495_004592 [Penicillium taxi]KAJ5899848.1 hypothetical protein N7495_004592 [Penicillium taxi]